MNWKITLSHHFNLSAVDQVGHRRRATPKDSYPG